MALCSQSEAKFRRAEDRPGKRTCLQAVWFGLCPRGNGEAIYICEEPQCGCLQKSQRALEAKNSEQGGLTGWAGRRKKASRDRTMKRPLP